MDSFATLNKILTMTHVEMLDFVQQGNLYNFNVKTDDNTHIAWSRMLHYVDYMPQEFFTQFITKIPLEHKWTCKMLPNLYKCINRMDTNIDPGILQIVIDKYKYKSTESVFHTTIYILAQLYIIRHLDSTYEYVFNMFYDTISAKKLVNMVDILEHNCNPFSTAFVTIMANVCGLQYPTYASSTGHSGKQLVNKLYLNQNVVMRMLKINTDKLQKTFEEFIRLGSIDCSGSPARTYMAPDYSMLNVLNAPNYIQILKLLKLFKTSPYDNIPRKNGEGYIESMYGTSFRLQSHNAITAICYDSSRKLRPVTGFMSMPENYAITQSLWRLLFYTVGYCCVPLDEFNDSDDSNETQHIINRTELVVHLLKQLNKMFYKRKLFRKQLIKPNIDVMDLIMCFQNCCNQLQKQPTPTLHGHIYKAMFKLAKTIHDYTKTFTDHCVSVPYEFLAQFTCSKWYLSPASVVFTLQKSKTE